MTLALLGNTLLRTAITRNLVSFPAQVRPFMKKASGDLQERIVQLYFVRGWSVRSICERYGLSKAMAHKLLAEWRIRAVESGYIQEIEPGNIAGLADAATDTHAANIDEAVNIHEATVNGIQPGMPVYIPAAVNVPEPALPRAFDYASAVTIPGVDNQAALSAGNGV
jgi:transposase-like protein